MQPPQRSPKGRGAGLYMGSSPARGTAPPAYARGASSGRGSGADTGIGRGRGRRGPHADLGDPYGGGFYGGYGGGGGAGAGAGVQPGKALLAAGFRAERLRQELPQRAYAVVQQVQPVKLICSG